MEEALSLDSGAIRSFVDTLPKVLNFPGKCFVLQELRTALLLRWAKSRDPNRESLAI